MKFKIKDLYGVQQIIIFFKKLVCLFFINLYLHFFLPFLIVNFFFLSKYINLMLKLNKSFLNLFILSILNSLFFLFFFFLHVVIFFSFQYTNYINQIHFFPFSHTTTSSLLLVDVNFNQKILKYKVNIILKKR